MENLNTDEIWAALLKKLEISLTTDICDMWIKPMKIISFEGGIFKIEVPNEVWLKTVKDRYESNLIEALSEVSNTTFSIEYTLPIKDTNKPVENIQDIHPRRLIR